MTTSRKSGSALLIVLGFLSFMVVSAVAFAIYMRAERMPSSALRRAVATRHLVHAALAEAIARVDDAVRGDPFPGLCDTNTDFSAKGTYTYRDQRGQAMDVWQGRVFMPPDPLGGTTTRETRFAPVTETVSVLTLEGLGYLPPGLVNDVRFLSRSSWAAQWQQLPFDAGRFAFCAVNVSDYFDVNRVWANRGRTSEAGGRLSLGYLFDPSFDPTAGNGASAGDVVNFAADAATFDRFVHTTRQTGDDKGNDNTQAVGSDTPYVSLLDYNLALGRNGGGSSLLPLFYNWIDRSSQSSYYQEGSQQAKSAARQPFVTESVSTNESWLVDLATAKGQPFYGRNLTPSQNVRVSDVVNYNSEFFRQVFSSGSKLLSPLDYVTLYDYLDHDDIPLSLAAPCVERVPMVAALEQTVQFAPGPMPAKPGPTTPGGRNQPKTSITYFDVDRNWFQPGVLTTVVAFPFKHGKTRNNHLSGGPFKVQALVRLFLAPPGLNARSPIAAQLRPQNDDDWKKGEDAFTFNGQSGVFMLSVRSQEVDLTLPNSVQDEADAFCTGGGGSGIVAIPVDFFGSLGVQNFPNDPHMLTVKTVEHYDDNGLPTGKKEKQYTLNIRPFIDANGNLPSGAQDISETEFNAVAGIEVVPYVCVWVRIDNDDGTVDLVPAYPDDDVLNGGAGGDPVLQTYGGSSAPLMRFVGDGVPFSLQTIAAGNFSGGTPTWKPKAMYTVDPRFNWAPESWYASEQSGVTFDKWLDATRSAVGMGTDATRDEDIFLFTSNQGVLQSLGEFAFLPRLFENGADLISASSFDGAERTAANQVANFACMWRSYPVDRNWYAQWAALHVGRSTARECLVNPYTDNRAVMMAALANTPVDYWAAGRGMAADCALRKDGAKMINDTDPWITTAADALKYAFGSKSDDPGDRLACQNLMSFADQIMTEMRTGTLGLIESNMGNNNWNPATAWEDIWDNLAWDIQQNGNSVTRFLGVDLGNNVALHSVDRKFLYSYWRDCFANNQQLFLIFVRAESNALGGPGEGTPAQQGGRAVALVWRNPAATDLEGRTYDAQNQYNTSGERKPHQTRVLFYHQFD